MAIHEAGHFLAGALVGYRWTGWSVGPLQVSREEGRVRVSLAKTLFDGYVMVAHHPNDTRGRGAVVLLGGSVANLLGGLATFWYLRHLPENQPDVPWQMTALLLMSFGLVLTNLTPYSHQDFHSDGMLLVQLWRDRGQWHDYYADRDRRNAFEAETARYDALTTLLASMEAGRRPRDWDASLMERSLTLHDGKPNEVAAVHFGFYWAADRGDWDRGGAYIRRALALRETLPGPWRAKVLLDGAYYAGLCQNDAVNARLLMEEASRIVAEDAEDRAMLLSMRLRAEAAALRAEGKPREAVEKARESLSSLAFVKGSDCSDRCLLEHFIAECLARTCG